MYVTNQCDLVRLCPLAMAGLLSPKPIPYNMQHTNSQFSNYGRGLSSFSETPPLPASSAQGQFSDNNSHHNLAIHEDEKIYSLVIDLMDPNTREGALLELSKKREQYDDLALVLWHSFGEL
jgi:CCR4-NOT transcription complex subunit 9